MAYELATPNFTKFYADAEKEFLLQEIERWTMKMTQHMSGYVTNQFVTPPFEELDILKIFKSKLKNGFESALDSCVYDKNLANLIAQFHDFEQIPGKFPMTAYRVKQRNACRQRIAEKVAQQFLKWQFYHINREVEEALVANKPVVFGFNMEPYYELLITVGLGEIPKSTLHDALCLILIKFYSLRGCNVVQTSDKEVQFQLFYP